MAKTGHHNQQGGTINKYLSIRNIQVLSAIMVGTFLVFHTGLLIFFWQHDIPPLAYINVFSIVFYLLCFLFIYRKMFKTLVVTVFFEVEIHMLATVLCVGWDYGFQVTLFGIALLAFFAEYIGRCMQMEHVPAIPLAVIGACFYLDAFMLSSISAAPYAANLADLRYELQLFWGIITFGIVITCMAAFTFVAFRSEEQLSTDATHDKLTGLPNRYFMEARIAKQAKEEGLGSCWLAMADIDDFKHVNDTYGHTFGDEVLNMVARAIAESDATMDVCRWGGEEFLMLGTFDGDMAKVCARLERVRGAIADHTLWHDDERVRVTITIGAAAYHDGESTVEWVNRADANLYAGKHNGKNQVVCES